MFQRRLTAPRAVAALGTGALIAFAAYSGASSATANEAGQSHVATTRAAAQAVQLRVLPQIIQPGKRTAASTSAKAAVVAEITPRQQKRPVTLERQSGETWVAVAKTKTNKKGNAEFAVSYSPAPVNYRVNVSAYKGNAALVTEPVSTDTWATAQFTDEFTGNKLGSSWEHRAGDYNPAGLRNCSKGSSKAVKVKGGTVQLSVMADKSKKKKLCKAKNSNGKVIGKYKYRLNGHIATQGHEDFTYGVAAARIKMQKSRGQHASFWLQPAQMEPGAKNAATGGAEIDIIEWFGTGGKEGGLTSFIYEPTKKGHRKVGNFIPNPSQYLSGKNDAWWKSYHVFSVEWTKTAYIFRIDGQETWRTNQGISGQPEFPILSLLSSDYELPKLGSEKRLPQKMNVDWVRIWQDPTP